MILLAALLFSAKWGVAAASHAISMQHFNLWNDQGIAPDEAVWERIHSMMTLSGELDPENAKYINDTGRLYEYAAWNMSKSEFQHTSYLLQSMIYFRAASRLRPAWPVAWANLALSKSKLGSVDNEYAHALEQAMLLGASQPVIHAIVTDAAISQWTGLSQALKMKVLHQIDIGLHSMNRSGVLRVIRTYKMCRKLEDEGILFENSCKD